MPEIGPADTTRRHVLIGIGGVAGASLLPARRAAATPDAMRKAIKAIVGTAPLRTGRVKIVLPPLVENGNAVPLQVTVESPMTEADHVKSIHVFTEKNPQPNVISVRLGPRAGTASVSTRMRLADTQNVVAVAQMSDGTFWSDQLEVVVTMPACLEEG